LGRGKKIFLVIIISKTVVMRNLWLGLGLCLDFSFFLTPC
jgi:hypothetical protein